MKTLLTIISIISLVGCGKEDSSNKENTKNIELLSEAYEDPDGDLLTGEHDPNPFIANIPDINEFIFTYNQEGEREYFTYKANTESLLGNLRKNLNNNILKSNDEVLTYILPSKADKLLFKKAESVSDVYLNLLDGDTKLQTIYLENYPKPTYNFPSEIMYSSNFRYELKSGSFKQSEQDINYNKVLKNIKSRSYELIIIDNKIDQHYISETKSIGESLDILNESNLSLKITESFARQAATHHQFLSNEEDLYRIFNAPSDLNYKPKAGEKIIIYKFTKNDLINKKTVQSDIKGIPSINLTYDFKNIKNIKIDLSSSSYTQAKRVNIDTYGHAIDHNDDFPSVKKCSYKTAKVERESKKIMHKEIDNHFEFFINNEKISYENLLEKNFSNEEDINLVIKLKKSSDKIKVGNYDNDPSRACKNITSRHGKVKFGLKDKSYPKIYNLNFKLITTQF